MPVHSVCSYPGCPTLTHGGRCPVHMPARPVDRRASAADRGYDHHWARYSLTYREANPYCRQCMAEGRRTATDVVDHIVPVTGREDPGFWDPSNHQPLCRSHHASKTAQEGRTQAQSPVEVEHAAEGQPWFFV